MLSNDNDGGTDHRVRPVVDFITIDQERLEIKYTNEYKQLRHSNSSMIQSIRIALKAAAAAGKK